METQFKASAKTVSCLHVSVKDLFKFLTVCKLLEHCLLQVNHSDSCLA